MAYCTYDDIIPLLGDDGITAFMDDDFSGDLDTTEQDLRDAIIERVARTQIDPYVEAIYGLTDAQVTGSTFLKYVNAVLAACAILARRGNPVPPSLTDERDELKALLVEVQAGRQRIPSLQNQYDHLPGVTNYDMEPLRGVQKPRVSQEQSTGDSPRTRKRHVSHPIYYYD